jgi:malic enzyme
MHWIVLLRADGPRDLGTDPGVLHTIGQANKALVFPGSGLGTIVARAERVSDGMLAAAASAVAALTDVSAKGASLLPEVGAWPPAQVEFFERWIRTGKQS